MLARLRAPGIVSLGLSAALLLAACGQGPSASSGAAPKDTAGAAAPKQAAQAPAAQTGGGSPIRLGFIHERTGPLALYGEAGARAVELYVEEVNAAGGLLGRSVEVLYRDSKGQQDEAVRQARDLLLNEKVDFLLHNINSAECLGVSEIAKEARKIVLSSCGVDDFTGSAGHRYAFRIPNNTTRTQGQATAKYAADRLGSFQTVYTVANDYTAGRSIVEFFRAKLREYRPDVQFVGESWPKFGETDYSPYITTIQNQKADVTMYFFATAVPFFNQAAPLNLQKQTVLLSAYWGGADELVTLKQESIPDGAVMGGFPWYALSSAENKQFVDKYRAKTNQPPRGSSYFQNMTLQFLAAAVRKAGTIDTEKVVDALEGMEADTLTGKARIRPFDHQGSTPYWIGTARWDPDLRIGVLADLVQLESEEFLPTEAEVRQARGQ
jgi:branched-chain amino acid transport system substrate-binding protein